MITRAQIEKLVKDGKSQEEVIAHIQSRADHNISRFGLLDETDPDEGLEVEQTP